MRPTEPFPGPAYHPCRSPLKSKKLTQTNPILPFFLSAYFHPHLLCFLSSFAFSPFASRHGSFATVQVARHHSSPAGHWKITASAASWAYVLKHHKRCMSQAFCGQHDTQRWPLDKVHAGIMGMILQVIANTAKVLGITAGCEINLIKILKRIIWKTEAAETKWPLSCRGCEFRSTLFLSCSTLTASPWGHWGCYTAIDRKTILCQRLEKREKREKVVLMLDSYINRERATPFPSNLLQMAQESRWSSLAVVCFKQTAYEIVYQCCHNFARAH